ncbi:hypothetical protein [Rufibacter roseolus]|uniref:hypothetical protein n=1 Tax=Rufibacter roseolus TaxID=2817375 RepID=UPI001B30BD9A|nr:hypothetical protein [Rufibacter roseolus]
MYHQSHVCRPGCLCRQQAATSPDSVHQEVKFPGKAGITPYAATNKAGAPVTQARIVILLNDRLPAFAIQTIILGKTPHITSGIGGLGGARVPIQTRGRRQFVSIPSKGARGNGGVLFLPESGRNVIHLLTWNVGRLSLSRNVGNETHAETQFLNWIRAHLQQYPKFLKRIRAIQILINNSPCGYCTADLCAFATKHHLGSKLKISWKRNYNKGTDSTANLQKLRQCGIVAISPGQSELLAEIKPQLKNLKLAKQQQHTYLLDKRVHSNKPQAVNRRAERLMTNSLKPTSLLSRVFASPHNYARVKQLFQGTINQGNYRQRPDGSYEAIRSFRFPTGWSYGKPVNRLKAIIDQKGNWHYYPVP